MTQQTKKVQLSNCEVEIIIQLTWGQYQDIEDVILQGFEIDLDGSKKINGKVMREQKYRLLETCVININENGELKQFSREWMNNLSMEDGKNLTKEVDEILKKK